jgi:hypothetical protein
MKRPTRNRLLFAAFWVACLVLGNVLPALVRLPFVLLVLGLASVSFVVARQFFAGRRHLRKKRWVEAITRFQAFEAELQQSAWKRRLSWLASGVYTTDPVALARNNVGVIHLEKEKLDLAEQALHSALERDAQYAVPHLNLAVVAAKRGDRATMDSELAEAARLGLADAKAHAKVRAALRA